MIKKISKNGVGLATLIVMILGWFSVEISIDTAQEFVLAAGTVISIGLMVVNQISRKDIAKFFFRR